MGNCSNNRIEVPVRVADNFFVAALSELVFVHSVKLFQRHDIMIERGRHFC